MSRPNQLTRRCEEHSTARGRSLLMLCVVILSVRLAFAGSPRIAKDLGGKRPSDLIDVIVEFRQAPTARHHQKVTSKGGTLKNTLDLVIAGSYSVPASAIPALAADPDVVYISPDRPLYSTNDGSPTAVLDHHTDSVNAPIAWAQRPERHRRWRCSDR